MGRKLVVRVGLAVAAVAVGLGAAAPAQADAPGRGACLTVVNKTAKDIRIVMKTTPIGNQAGWSYTIGKRSKQILRDGGGNNLLSPDGSWKVDGPGGQWWFDDQMTHGACNGSWYYTVG
ncbi:hypothetical protein [Nocardia sp. SSK8]|uniref:hypothetical protein n=1 Tax=Nocardia sp. SSK8 TaxID=3120154 RepID=UPI003008C901